MPQVHSTWHILKKSNAQFFYMKRQGAVSMIFNDSRPLQVNFGSIMCMTLDLSQKNAVVFLVCAIGPKSLIPIWVDKLMRDIIQEVL